jgi:hypothetical protein
MNELEKETHFKPPKMIYRILHKAEAQGIKIPFCIDRWWQKETMEEEKLRQKGYFKNS